MGRIEVISGPMFSGKSEELIRRIRRALIAKQRVLTVKPHMDDRYSKTKVVSHNGTSTDAEVFKSSAEIAAYVDANGPYDVIAIEEAQFFDSELLGYVMQWKTAHHKVIIAGLDMDHMGQPFGCMGSLMAISDKVSKLKAVCRCKLDATMTYKKKDTETLIEVGGAALYEPMCFSCWKDD